MTRKVLWRPSDERRDASTMQKYINWLSINHGLEFSNYDQLWSWSVSDLNFFLANYLGLLPTQIS